LTQPREELLAVVRQEQLSPLALLRKMVLLVQ
jgi:hypothetical protein